MTSPADARPSSRATRVVMIAAGALAVLGIAAAVGAGLAFPRTWSCPEVVTYRIGGLDAAWTQVLGVMVTAVALLVLTVAAAVRAGHRDRPGAQVFLVFLAVVGVLALWPMFVGAATVTRTWAYTEIAGDTGGRDLLVREWSFLLGGGGEVVERDGGWLTRIARTSTDDGYAPFSAGNYSVTNDDGEITLRWSFHAEDGAENTSVVLPPSGEPAPGVTGCASPVVDAEPVG